MVLGSDHAWAAGEEVGGQVGGRRARPREENGSRGKKTRRTGRPLARADRPAGAGHGAGRLFHAKPEPMKHVRPKVRRAVWTPSRVKRGGLHPPVRRNAGSHGQRESFCGGHSGRANEPRPQSRRQNSFRKKPDESEDEKMLIENNGQSRIRT